MMDNGHVEDRTDWVTGEKHNGYIVGVVGAATADATLVPHLKAMLRVHVPNADTAGSWFHKGQYYVDAGLWISDLDTALEVGREHKQISIWDLANEREIRVSYI